MFAQIASSDRSISIEVTRADARDRILWILDPMDPRSYGSQILWILDPMNPRSFGSWILWILDPMDPRPYRS
ncbi:unnamed protein product [Caenorhabditis nigoni]